MAGRGISPPESGSIKDDWPEAREAARVGVKTEEAGDGVTAGVGVKTEEAGDGVTTLPPTPPLAHVLQEHASSTSCGVTALPHVLQEHLKAAGVNVSTPMPQFVSAASHVPGILFLFLFLFSFLFCIRSDVAGLPARDTPLCMPLLETEDFF